MGTLKERLVEQAQLARELAHAPYSGYKVGAALITEDGEVFTGCNVENASYGATVCAERVAIFSAVAAGMTGFSTLVVVTPGPEPAPPCGICLQVISEFVDDMPIWLAGPDTSEVVETSLARLLPNRFKIDS
jgi:cytidine deaminase